MNIKYLIFLTALVVAKPAIGMWAVSDEVLNPENNNSEYNIWRRGLLEKGKRIREQKEQAEEKKRLISQEGSSSPEQKGADGGESVQPEGHAEGEVARDAEQTCLGRCLRRCWETITLKSCRQPAVEQVEGHQE